MSFSKLKQAELLQLAREDFGVDVDESHNQAQILAALATDGVTWEQAVLVNEAAKAVDEKIKEKAAQAAAKKAAASAPPVALPGENVVTTTTIATTAAPETIVEKTVVASKPVVPEKVLLKMERENGSYEVRGYKFTKQHPYALVKSTDAEYIVENIEGFYYASPKEAAEFYG